MIFRLDSDRFIDIGIRHVAAPQSIKLLSIGRAESCGEIRPAFKYNAGHAVLRFLVLRVSHAAGIFLDTVLLKVVWLSDHKWRYSCRAPRRDRPQPAVAL